MGRARLSPPTPRALRAPPSPCAAARSCLPAAECARSASAGGGMGPGSGAAGRALAGLGSIRKRVRAGALGAGAGRRAQGGTRSSGRLLGLREGGLGRRRGRELERRRLELDLARHLQRGQTRQRCTLQRNRTAAGALSKSPARTDAEAQTHSSAKTMRANSASGRHLLVELVLLELLELALQLVVVEVDPRVQLAAARRGHCQWGEARKAGGGGRC